MPVIIDNPVVKIAPEILKELSTFTYEKGQVVVHGLTKKTTETQYIRIWPTTFLFDLHSDHISELIYYEKISGFPIWTEIPRNVDYRFTLIFEGLPKSCTVFDLTEVIPQSYGFYVPSVHRNEQDVYFLDFS
ncbi:MAG: hypothetical protein WAT22_11755 [Saprospiraceae bacterium]